MKNNLNLFFKTFHDSIDFFIPEIQLDLSDAFPGNFFLISFISVHREMISNNKNTSIFNVTHIVRFDRKNVNIATPFCVTS